MQCSALPMARRTLLGTRYYQTDEYVTHRGAPASACRRLRRLERDDIARRRGYRRERGSLDAEQQRVVCADAAAGEELHVVGQPTSVIAGAAPSLDEASAVRGWRVPRGCRRGHRPGGTAVRTLSRCACRDGRAPPGRNRAAAPAAWTRPGRSPCRFASDRRRTRRARAARRRPDRRSCPLCSGASSRLDENPCSERTWFERQLRPTGLRSTQNWPSTTSCCRPCSCANAVMARTTPG